jgi:hypothetical protein
MDTQQGFLRPFFETILSAAPFPGFLQMVQGLASFLNAIMAFLGIPLSFEAF